MKTHRTDLTSLLFGLFFGLIAFIGFSGQIGIQIEDTRWVWPLGLMVLGVVVLAGTGMRRRDDELEGPDQDAEAATTDG